MATYKVKSNGTEHTVHILDNPGGGATVTVDDDEVFQVEFTGGGAEVPAAMAELPVVHAAHAPAAPTATSKTLEAAGPGGIAAPIPGKILSIDVAIGDHVDAGQVVLTLEAMKMENNVVAPISGVVSQVVVGEGSEVASGQLLMVIEP